MWTATICEQSVTTLYAELTCRLWNACRECRRPMNEVASKKIAIGYKPLRCVVIQSICVDSIVRSLTTTRPHRRFTWPPRPQRIKSPTPVASNVPMTVPGLPPKRHNSPAPTATTTCHHRRQSLQCNQPYHRRHRHSTVPHARHQPPIQRPSPNPPMLRAKSRSAPCWWTANCTT